MTEPRDGAPEEALEPIDGEALDDDVIDDGGEPIDDADVDAIDGELLDEAEVEADEADVDDYDAALREVAGESGATAAGAALPSAERRTSVGRRGAGPATTRAPSPSEIAVHVREDVSKFFVIATVAVFTIILLNGLLLGSGGLLRPIATPTPTPSPTPSATASPSPSSTSPLSSTSPSPSTNPSPSSSPSPSAS